ncbi:MAG TPA: BrnT family toxin [Bryocella sp.]|nr:BrnT family toxin [Bryocella sp.]
MKAAFGTGFSPWCTIVHTMDFAWDPAKAASNLLKHGVRFADAVSALEDDFALTMRDPFAEDEERWVTLGMDAGGNLLVVIYTWRGRTSRIISPRPATPRERRQYYEEKR